MELVYNLLIFNVFRVKSLTLTVREPQVASLYVERSHHAAGILMQLWFSQAALVWYCFRRVFGCTLLYMTASTLQ